MPTPEVAAAMRAAMNLQRQILEMSALGSGSSQLNMRVTLQQMWVDHSTISRFLQALDDEWKPET